MMKNMQAPGGIEAFMEKSQESQAIENSMTVLETDVANLIKSQNTIMALPWSKYVKKEMELHQIFLIFSL